METSQSKKCVRNVTKEEYEAALAEIEKMQRDGGCWHIWAGHMATALEYEIAHGINPGSFPGRLRRRYESRKSNQARKMQ